MVAFLDTHAFIALGEGRADRFGRDSRRLLSSADLAVSPAVLLEMHFLREIGRLVVDPGAFYDDVSRECDIREVADPMGDVVRRATALAWTRDPFDRMIVATAILHGSKLITKDGAIHDHFDDAVW